MIALLVSVALGAPAWNAPSATPTEGVRLAVGGGAAVLQYGPLPSARLAGATDLAAVGVTGSSTVYVGSVVERFDVVGACWRAVDRERLRLGPLVVAGHHAGSTSLDTSVKVRAGVAVEGGGERLRGDASLTVVGLGWHPGQPIGRLTTFESALGSELGVSWLAGAHRVRLGLLGPLPALRYGWAGERVDVALTGATMGPTGSLAQAELGLGF